ncbi:phage holin family protein [Anaerosalibacter sp. Marseille-P3206]|uniref:phage holin family protein n=1 Tax=Anaerosalibacter sp. Marseille-P3206 TaxID=1871005 RepID=UPI000985DF30|nr:phage holin family protein [Anaerosalibacter sp. Marseille-P3206]
MDNNDNNNKTRDTKNISIGEILLRILITAIVVGVAAFFTPGFSINNLWSLILAAIVIALLDYFVQKIAGIDASPFGRGITGFIVSAIILYVTKFIVPGFNISLWGAIIGALVIGIIDAIIPGKQGM